MLSLGVLHNGMRETLDMSENEMTGCLSRSCNIPQPWAARRTKWTSMSLAAGIPSEMWGPLPRFCRKFTPAILRMTSSARWPRAPCWPGGRWSPFWKTCGKISSICSGTIRKSLSKGHSAHQWTESQYHCGAHLLWPDWREIRQWHLYRCQERPWLWY